MAVLGIEGTAHTLGVGIVERDSSGKCRILANERSMVRPPPPGPDEAAMGIHPREAAHHHGEVGPALLEKALDAAGLSPKDLEAVAFSQGPGLGPCLRVAATMARSLSIAAGKPLIGVNHCVAHLEIARGLTDAKDPMLLYVSGANTQVLAYVRGRYRVFGETLDVGLGNALDKFAREQGIPFPGGPEVERLAATAARDSWRDLPYTVKGMDVSFAGLATAASRLVTDGVPLPEVCRAFQEHAFAALVETAERALAHTGRNELALGGGVACNARLQDMARLMCNERGATMHCPPRDVLVDNGAMIAWLGTAKLAVGDVLTPETSAVTPYERTDQVAVTWRSDEAPMASLPRPFGGAEAVLEPARFLGAAVLQKRRLPKAYRDARLDAAIRAARTRDEAHLLVAARRAGVAVPIVHDVDRKETAMALEPIAGESLQATLRHDADDVACTRLAALGTAVGRLHDAGLSHGDLTTSNVLVPDAGAASRVVLIDFGLGSFSDEPEPRGVDLHLLEEALEATEPRSHDLFAAFLGAYSRARCAPAAIVRLDAIRSRGRYR
ncbi:MAG: bifunctional N(6)-L-threonylcarbamoyladenine synthase/serine/threonine protein kinase [bacterium]